MPSKACTTFQAPREVQRSGTQCRSTTVLPSRMTPGSLQGEFIHSYYEDSAIKIEWVYAANNSQLNVSYWRIVPGPSLGSSYPTVDFSGSVNVQRGRTCIQPSPRWWDKKVTPIAPVPTYLLLYEGATGRFDIPTKASIEFYTAWISYNLDVWADPMEFRPEHFLEGWVDFDITENKHVKMISFGVGRRICPCSSLGMLRINLILAHMVQVFHWSPRDGKTPDLTKKFAFTVIMKNLLYASINPRD
eukprot:Gb_01486 [translate_table: standard]